jgi:hypothetical protein
LKNQQQRDNHFYHQENYIKDILKETAKILALDHLIFHILQNILVHLLA